MKKCFKATPFIVVVVCMAIMFFSGCSSEKSTDVDENVKESEESDRGFFKVENSSKFGTMLNEKEAKYITNEDFYVWYKVPEINVRFKVSPDSKDDLKYIVETIKSEDTKEESNTIYFYSDSAVKFIRETCIHNEKVGKECSEGSLGRVYNKEKCRNGKIVTNTNEGYICFVGSQAPLLTGEMLKDYSKTVEDKEFGIYLGTTESIE